MKKRLISLLVALCMAVTLLPVSALTAWAEGGDQLKIADGYPVGSIDANGTHTTSCSGDGWSYDGTDKVLTLAPQSHTTYDLIDGGSIRQDQNSNFMFCHHRGKRNDQKWCFLEHRKSWFQYYQLWHYNEWRLRHARCKSWYYYRRHFS